MFSKKRSSSNPPAQRHQAPTPSATSAAALAFLNKRASNANLSSAAAAAALRSYQTSPEPVGSIQTKRMIRRGSVSSINGASESLQRNGSASGGSRQPFTSGLQRTGSTTSMTNRTFRSPSPGGRNLHTSSAIPSDAPPIPSKSHRRNPSNESSQRVASPRLASPLPHISTAAANTTPQETTVRYDPNTRTLIRVPVQPTTQQSGSPNSPRSINFSRPMSPPVTYNARPKDPVRARPATAQGFSTSNSLSGVAQGVTANGAIRPAQAKIATGPSSTAEAVPALVAASTAARISPATPAVPDVKPAATAAKPPSIGPDVNSATTAAKPASTVPDDKSATTATNLASTVPNSSNTVSPQHSLPTTAATSSPTATSQIRNPVQSSPIPAPSQEQIKAFQTRAASMLARPRTDAAAVAAAAPNVQNKSLSEESVPSPTAPQITGPTSTTTPETAPQPPAVPRLTAITTDSGKASSHSPTRSAHFSESPLLEGIKHQPPVRAISPAKSALKAPSPRPSSPANSTSKAMSDTSETRSDDGFTTKKKKGVSFDEQPVLVGQATTPQTPINTVASPQYRKGPSDAWPSDDEHDYAPRPTLPLFGSIRGQKTPTPPREPSPQTPVREPQPQASPTTSDPSNDAARGLNFVQPDSVESEPEPITSELNESTVPSESIPAISVLPATPRIDQENKELISSTDTVEQSPTDQGEPVKLGSPRLDTDSDENNEIFTDAAEDPVDPIADEGDLAEDANIERPLLETAPQTIPEDPDEGSVDSEVGNKDDFDMVGVAVGTPAPTATQPASQPEESEDWERIRRYWNSLSEERKQELEREAAGEPSNLTLDAGADQEPDKEAPLPPWPDQEYQQSVNVKPTTLPLSLRSEHDGAGSDTSQLKPPAREVARPVSAYVESKLAATSSKRPKSAIATTTTTPSANAVALTSQALGEKKSGGRPPLERTLSNDSSASESSFRRRRRGSVASSEGGGFSLRKTMRGAPRDAGTKSPPPGQTTRLSLRASSPPAVQPTRTSLRSSGNSQGANNTMRSLRTSEARSSNRNSILGFGKSPKPSRGSGKTSSRFMSRFDDSSDEEGGSRPRFLSRFDESDDSDDDVVVSRAAKPSNLSPTMRKTNRPVSADSSDLSTNELASRNTARKLKPALKDSAARPSTPPNANGAVQGGALHAGTLRGAAEGGSTASSPEQQGTSKRGFFGLGKKKPSVSNMGDAGRLSTPVKTTGSPGVSQVQAGKSTAETSARPRSRLFRHLSSGSAAQITTKEEFPYPPPPIPSSFEDGKAVERPNTSDGTSSTAVETPTRPVLGNKRDSAMTAPVEPASPITSERTGKKKKFQGLRRLLKVHD